MSKLMKHVMELSPDARLSWARGLQDTALLDLETAAFYLVMTGLWSGASRKGLQWAVRNKLIKNEGMVINPRTGELNRARRRVQVRVHALKAYVARKGLV